MTLRIRTGVLPLVERRRRAEIRLVSRKGEKEERRYSLVDDEEEKGTRMSDVVYICEEPLLIVMALNERKNDGALVLD